MISASDNDDVTEKEVASAAERVRNESRLGNTTGNSISGKDSTMVQPGAGNHQPDSHRPPKTPACDRPAPDPAAPPPPTKRPRLAKKKKLFGSLPVAEGLEKTGMRPAGLTDEELNAMDPQFAINLFKAQKVASSSKEPAKEKAAVGRVQVQRKVVDTLVHIPAHDDNGDDLLNPARFLPPPTCSQKKIWSLLPESRPVQPPRLEVSQA